MAPVGYGRAAQGGNSTMRVPGRPGLIAAAVVLLLCFVRPCWAVDTAAMPAAARGLGLAWALPFVGMLLSIALMPPLVPRFWHRHFGKVSASWAAAFLIPSAAAFGLSAAAHELLHALLAEYVPFILLLFALFVVAGGIQITGHIPGTPAANTAVLAAGTALASLLGTTGAAMLLIRPLIRANQDRARKTHVFVFFIFLVANIGGSLTPLGDPPLFLGFLQGVDFGWTFRALLGPMLFCTVALLGLFYAIDGIRWRQERYRHVSRGRSVRVYGAHNFLLLAGIVGAVLVSGGWHPTIAPRILGISVPLQDIVRDLALIALALISIWTTPRRIRIENAFTWEPIQEVATLFAGLFVTIAPVLTILKAGHEGALAGIVALLSGPGGEPSNSAYFWLTGILSSVLDNAPTYLAFFNMAGGDSDRLMNELAPTLTAISCGAVFFGAITYIGNAPNFMVRLICEERGIKMPSFFGYVIWSCTILLPLFAAMRLIFDGASEGGLMAL